MFNTQGNGTFKYNLEQGKAILNYNEEVDDIVKPHLKIIQEGSLIEGLNGSSGLSLKDKKTVEGLQSIENEFNKTIAQYNQVYKQFSEDLMNRKNQLNEVSPLYLQLINIAPRISAPLKSVFLKSHPINIHFFKSAPVSTAFCKLISLKNVA